MPRAWNELLMDDHQTADKAFAAMEKAFATPEGPSAEMVRQMLEFFSVYVDRVHNMKEEQHLFPLIESLGVPRQGGPLAVMLAEHEQSRTLLAQWKPLAEAVAAGDRSKLDALHAVFLEYSSLLKNHFWKENDILYPIALRVMRPQDGVAVVAGIESVEAAMGPDTRARYYRIAESLAEAGEVQDLSVGVERAVMAAILNTLPVELSFVDADDTVRYFSHEDHDKIFPRTRSVIGMQVHNCHPEKSLHVVNQILSDFKAGRRSVAEFWIDVAGKQVHIRYFPVRDKKGQYLGCLEVVQDVTGIKALKGERRLLDA
jgi:DUF438 domain-containing protein